MDTTRSLSKTYKFECAHRLNLDYNSPCLSLHGHSYKVKVKLYVKELNHNDMIIDFMKLKTFQKHLDDVYDHSIVVNVNDKELMRVVEELKQKCVRFKTNTTSERLAEIFCEEFYQMYQ